MTNEIVLTFKGKSSADPWIVVHSDPASVNQALDAISAELIARVHATQEHFNAGPALAQLASPVAQAAPLPQQNQPSPEWASPPPDPQQYAQQAPPSPAPAPPVSASPQGDVNLNGAVIWKGPNPAKPQYEAVFFTVPFIKDKATRDAFFKALKDGAWAKPHDTGVQPWVYIAPKGGTEQLVRDVIAQYAPYFSN